MQQQTTLAPEDERKVDRLGTAWSGESAALEAAVSGRYALERELGRGTTGIVYKARDVALDRRVAIKLLHPFADIPRVRERFLEEARTIAAMAHPNVVQIYAVEQAAELVFFVMPYVVGETLGARVRRAGPLGPASALRCMRQVARALVHAHSRGVVHRDVKPDNIVLEHRSGRAKLVDFGISVRLEPGRSSMSDWPVGTPHFMSPEQASGGAVDARSDLYALGATVFYALAGRPPFDAPSLPALLDLVRTAPLPRLHTLRPDVASHLEAAVERCLAKAPLERFPSAGCLLAALTRVTGVKPRRCPPGRP